MTLLLRDQENIEKLNVELLSSDLVTLEDGTIKHNGLKLGSLIFSYIMR